MWNKALTNVGDNIAQSLEFYRQRHDKMTETDNTINELAAQGVIDKKTLERVRVGTDREKYANEKGFLAAFQIKQDLAQSQAKIGALNEKARIAGLGGELSTYTAPDGTKFYYTGGKWHHVGGGATTATATGVASRFEVKELDQQIKGAQKQFADEDIDPDYFLDSSRHHGGIDDGSGNLTQNYDHLGIKTTVNPKDYTHVGVEGKQGAMNVYTNKDFTDWQKKARQLQDLKMKRDALIKGQTSGTGTSEKVHVKLKDGRTGYVLRSDLQKWGNQIAEVHDEDSGSNASPPTGDDDDDEKESDDDSDD